MVSVRLLRASRAEGLSWIPPLTRLVTATALLSPSKSRRASIKFDEAKTTMPRVMLPSTQPTPLKKLFSSVEVYCVRALLPVMNDGELNQDPCHEPLLNTRPSPNRRE